MNISLEKVGKRFNKNWIFKNLNIDIPSNESFAITGTNGSGKSTLLQIIAGYLSPSSGKVKYGTAHENPQLLFNFCAPYFELIEEYTLMEFLEFHSQFKTPLFSFEEMCVRSGLEKDINKTVGSFSSGMKQRVKLIICFFFNSEVLFLDEPTSNLDEEGINWYLEEVTQVVNKTIIIASNQAYEYSFSSKSININNHQN